LASSSHGFPGRNPVNNWIETSKWPVPRRERQTQGFRYPRQRGDFLFARLLLYGHLHLARRFAVAFIQRPGSSANVLYPLSYGDQRG